MAACSGSTLYPERDGANAPAPAEGSAPSPALNSAAVDTPRPFAGRADSADRNGYQTIDPARAAPVREAIEAWLGCIVYGIRQIDMPNEPATTIADGALAGCLRAETNLEDRLFEAMSGADDPREVRSLANDIIRGHRERMRGQAIRLVLAKHQQERADGSVRNISD